MTDINDFLKIVWSNLAKPVCPVCGLELSRWDASTLASLLERWCEAKPDATFVLGIRVKNVAEQIDRLQTLGYSRYFRPSTASLEQFEDAPPPKRARRLPSQLTGAASRGLPKSRCGIRLSSAFRSAAAACKLLSCAKSRLRP